MRHKLSLAAIPLLCIALTGCAARTEPDADSIDLQLSDPTGNPNANLARFDTANDWQRSRSGTGLTTSAAVSPGPTGVTTRTVRVVLAVATAGSQYSLQPDNVNYVEYSEATSTGTRVWRSESGSVTLVADDAKISSYTLSNVRMATSSGGATGRFTINGPIIIRF